MTGRGLGAAEIIATVDGVSGAAQVQIELPAEFSITLRRDSLVFGEGAELPPLAPVAHVPDGREIPGVEFSFLSSDGEIVAVGSDGTVRGRGTLGRATVTVSAGGQVADLPVRFTAGWEKIYTTGGRHACGIRVGGAAYCWGSGGEGRLGVDPQAFPDMGSARPLPVQGGHQFESLTLGEHTTCGLTADGRAWCWGSNRTGALGTGRSDETCAWGSTPCSDEPLEVTGGHSFVQLDAGEDHTCGVDLEGVAWCWGYNIHGAVGVPDAFGEASPASYLRTPMRVSGGAELRSVITAGWQTSGGLGTDGRPNVWGLLYGPLTDAQRDAGCPEGEYKCWLPMAIPGGPASFSQVEYMYRPGACGLDDARNLFCWGSEDARLIGPERVAMPEPLEWLGPNELGRAICGLTAEGRPFCVGHVGGSSIVSEPFAPRLPEEDVRFDWIASGFLFDQAESRFQPGICGITAETNLAYCWPDDARESEPTLLPDPLEAPGS